VGWLEVKGMMVSVNVGFLNMAVLMFVGVLCGYVKEIQSVVFFSFRRKL